MGLVYSPYIRLHHCINHTESFVLIEGGHIHNTIVFVCSGAGGGRND